MDYAAEHGQLNVLKWLYEQHDILPDVWGANLAAENGHLNVLEWLSQYNILPNVDVAN